jgi:hypothetical protein
MIRHRHRPTLRGLVIDVDLLCVQTDDWAFTASCLERAAAQGVPPDECMVEGTGAWRKQPFYVVLPDLTGTPWEKDGEEGAGTEADLPWPTELSAWQVRGGCGDVARSWSPLASPWEGNLSFGGSGSADYASLP